MKMKTVLVLVSLVAAIAGPGTTRLEGATSARAAAHGKAQ
jgi:hypothetical protein